MRTKKINHSENDQALKHMFKSKVKSMKKEKWKNKALHGQYPRILEKPHIDTVITYIRLSSNLKGETEGLLLAAQDQAVNTRNYQKVICGLSKWRANAECVHNMKRQWTILYLDVRYKTKQSTSPGTIRLQLITTGAFVKIMISRLQTNGTSISQRL